MITVVCFEGAGSSSSSGLPLTDVVERQIKAMSLPGDVALYSLEIASTRKLARHMRDICFPLWRPLVCIGKSLGAVRMFRALDRLGIVPEAIVSIDPLTAWRMLWPRPLKPSEALAEHTVNLYQDGSFGERGALRGVEVAGAANILVRRVDHMSIVRSRQVRHHIVDAMAWAHHKEIG